MTIAYQGWVCQYTPSRRLFPWKRRYFVLTSTALLVYKSEKASQAAVTCEGNATVCSLAEYQFVQPYICKRSAHAIIMEPQTMATCSAVIFHCSTGAEHQDWIEAIHHQIIMLESKKWRLGDTRIQTVSLLDKWLDQFQKSNEMHSTAQPQEDPYVTLITSKSAPLSRPRSKSESIHGTPLSMKIVPPRSTSLYGNTSKTRLTPSGDPKQRPQEQRMVTRLQRHGSLTLKKRLVHDLDHSESITITVIPAPWTMPLPPRRCATQQKKKTMKHSASTDYLNIKAVGTALSSPTFGAVYL
ncbi:uncharacterized protein BYT42DRAFT_570586 [Radiomyces spectabilis]|uniref:uncharacterized protein n=1 Tax=Radiomyces spectabilis TaxID=64574 RepID=UPI00221E84E2|nr:uncharacterized protein BYT42DRAFT_570586 [Radiomyces spectabilis]KAI8377520.1 hypothetical protein BYT42DRAFT_570586 [Radiomyces spectabilis]